VPCLIDVNMYNYYKHRIMAQKNKPSFSRKFRVLVFKCGRNGSGGTMEECRAKSL
jgi:hypothetical protein